MRGASEKITATTLPSYSTQKSISYLIEDASEADRQLTINEVKRMKNSIGDFAKEYLLVNELYN